MKIFKHLFKVIYMLSKQKFCKHNNIEKSSCPFTGLTYETCTGCWKRISAVKTNG